MSDNKYQYGLQVSNLLNTNLINNQMDTPSASSTAIADAETTMIRRRTIQWPGGRAIKQRFSLPESIMYYITMNPSTPKCYNKLIQTCKYFFEANPILVAASFTACLTEERICSNDKCYGYGKCCVKIDIKKITSKIWLTGELHLYETTMPNFTALLRAKIYRCDNVAFVKIIGGTVGFEDFKFVGLSAKQIELKRIQIVHEGNPVMLENVLEALSNVEYYYWIFKNNDSMVSASTAKNMSKLKNLGKLKFLFFYNTPELFKLDDLFAFIKDHSDIIVWLQIAFDISEEYKNELDQFVDSLIEAKLLNCYICYPGQN